MFNLLFLIIPYLLLTAVMTHARKCREQFIFEVGNDALQSAANTSLSFEKFAVQCLQSLGLTVVAVEEYYTSQICTKCHDFVDSVGMRVKHCVGCAVYFHRDGMGWQHNIIPILKSQYLKNARLATLTPPAVWERGLILIRMMCSVRFMTDSKKVICFYTRKTKN